MAKLLEIKDLRTYFFTEEGVVRAVDGVTWHLDEGETLGLVGESGCGKSVTAMSILRLVQNPPGRIVDGSIIFEGQDLLQVDDAEMRSIRGNRIAMVFQEPMTSLNPVLTIGRQIKEAITLHLGLQDAESTARAVELLEMVGIPEADSRLSDYPHQFSGGMRQRVMIAMALSCNPKLLIADEPTTALDVTIQAQILEIMARLSKELGTAVLVITHNLGVVARYADRVNVMYAGKDRRERHRRRHLQAPTPPLHGRPDGIGAPPRRNREGETCYDRRTAAPVDPADRGLLLRATLRLGHRQVRDGPTAAGGEGAGPHGRLLAQPGDGRTHGRRNQCRGCQLEREMPMTTEAPTRQLSAVPLGETLLEVTDLQMYFPVTAGLFIQRKIADVRAVDGLSFKVTSGETLGLVGESGCGKSTTGRAILQLHRPTAGSVRFGGVELTETKGRELRRFRRRMQMIFQDPFSSLNPRMSVEQIIGEPMAIHGLYKGDERRDRVEFIMNAVGLNPLFAKRYPHEFSGGQRQRIGIGRALAVEPEFIVCDEPVSALDVSIQAQVINLLEDLQSEFGLTYLFIAHDLAVVRHISDRVAVMYLGKMMELADSNELYENPLHPYTKALLSAVPITDPELERTRERIILTGDVPSPLRPPPGCVFNTRCPIVIDECRERVPEWREVSTNHWAACHRV